MDLRTKIFFFRIRVIKVKRKIKQSVKAVVAAAAPDL